MSKRQAQTPIVIGKLEAARRQLETAITLWFNGGGNVCWETDVLPASVIRAALDAHVLSWLAEEKWSQRDAEIEAARKLL
jgi:hypothetical protein